MHRKQIFWVSSYFPSQKFLPCHVPGFAFAMSDITMCSKVPASFLVSLVANGQIPQNHLQLLWFWALDQTMQSFLLLVSNTAVHQLPDFLCDEEGNLRFSWTIILFRREE